MAKEPVVLIHGYSDRGESFKPWKDALEARGYETVDVPVCTYKSLTNEVTIKDLAEAFDRALRTLPNLRNGEPFNAIVHSTGMLVLRSWLATYAARRDRLKRLIGLAPASFGSPLAHKGRGFLGAVFKGNKTIGPDFLAAGDLILDALELGSRFTWDLAHQDLLGDTPFYGRSGETPYVFVFCGTSAYGGIRQLVNEPAMDGTVRWAGCSLDTQKITVDFTRDSARAPETRVKATNTEANAALPIPFWPIAGKNHADLIGDPGDSLIEMVQAALQVSSSEEFDGWTNMAETRTQADWPKEEWQQFVVRAVDERGDPIHDWFIELFVVNGDTQTPLDFDPDVHAYVADTSLRCFHVNLSKLKPAIAAAGGGELWARVIASSGSALVGYHGIHSEKMSPDGRTMHTDGVWDAQIAIPTSYHEGATSLFYPFTTTLVELRLNREPVPFGEIENELCAFLPP